MPVYDTEKILSQVQAALEQEDVNGAIGILEQLKAADQAEVFYELDNDQQIALLSSLNPSVSADILEELEDEEAADHRAQHKEDHR